MNKTGKPFRRGVSLLETVLASSLLGGAVMVVCGLSAGSLRSVRLNQEYEKAWDYIERQLTLIDLIGVQTVVQTGQNTGQFESLDGRIWEWNVQIAESGIPLLYDVLIGVEWEGAGRLRRVECLTRMTARIASVDAEQMAPDADAAQEGGEATAVQGGGQ